MHVKLNNGLRLKMNMIQMMVNVVYIKKEMICIYTFIYFSVNNRPRIIDERLKQLQPHQNKSKPSTTKSANDDLKKLIQERRKAAANLSNTANQNHDVEIFVNHK